MIENFKKQLIKSNYEFEEITDEVLLVKNILSKEETDFIWSKINEASQADWEIEYLSNLPKFCMEKFGRDDVENLVAEGKFEITQNWADKNLNISSYSEYYPMYEKFNNLGEMNNNFYRGNPNMQDMQHQQHLQMMQGQYYQPARP